MDTVILIPAYKPTSALLETAASLSEAGCSVLVVDDGSGEAYAETFQKAASIRGVTVIHQNPNQGKGAAIKQGIRYVVQNCPACAYIVTADADGQHTTQDILALSQELHKQGGFVIGARQFEGQVPLRSRFGNSITKLVFMVAAGKKCSDTQTGLRGFSRDLFSFMQNIKGDRYEYEMNVLMQCAQGDIEIREIPIKTVYENNNEGSHFRTVVDSVRIYWIILFYSTLVRYGLSAVFCFLLDFSALSILEHFIQKPIALPTLLARCISSPINYLINRKIVFNSNANKATSFLSYLALAACVIGVKMGLMTLLVDLLGWHYALSNILIEVVVFISNFLIQKLVIFRKKKRI